MKPARILLLAVALVAGGLAAFLATRGDSPAPAQIQAEAPVVEEARRQVLVASAGIGVGQRLDETIVEWQDWPESMVREEYITSDIFPDADAQMVGTVARFEIFTGEPIRQSKLIRTDQGYLSAVIEQGMRAVSVGVSAESGAGGFIVPNDRVDVVQTYRA
ncbi:MAG TPA: Flp pilus assembly protein CpaB, partial [Devosia sp.]|nr:Flp pilus assembly protein CpaB [Devosia sp.]